MTDVQTFDCLFLKSSITLNENLSFCAGRLILVSFFVGKRLGIERRRECLRLQQ